VNLGLELLLATAVAGAGAVPARLLFRRGGADSPPTPLGPRLREAAATNTLGFLLIGSVIASSGLFADALCRMVELPG